jgi:hypothetical protein
MDEMWTRIQFDDYDEMMDHLDELKKELGKEPKYLIRPRIITEDDGTFTLDIKIHILCLN